MPPPGFQNPYTGESISADEFANMGGPTNNYDPRGAWDKLLQALPFIASAVAAAPTIAGAFGGGGGASTAGAASTVPEIGVTSGIPAGASIGTTVAAPTVGGALASTPIAGTAALPSGASSLAGGAGGTEGFLSSLREPGTVKNLLSGYLAVKNLFGGGRPSTSDQYSDLLRNTPALRELLDLQIQQQREKAPLHKALVQMSLSRLPRSVRASYGGE